MNAEQCFQNSNVRIKEIPSQNGHDLMKVLINVESIVGGATQEGNVEVCHQIPVPNSDAKNVVMPFVSRKKRKQFSQEV